MMFYILQIFLQLFFKKNNFRYIFINYNKNNKLKYWLTDIYIAYFFIEFLIIKKC